MISFHLVHDSCYLQSVISGVGSESDYSFQVRIEVPLSVVESRGPLIDPCYFSCSLEDGDQERCKFLLI
jgi:hypothetical protein